jgi:soluble lytic murein transglycosylase-like protein
MFRRFHFVLAAPVFLTLAAVHARAAEHITLRNGFELDCARRVVAGDRIRLYLLPASPTATETSSYIEVSAASVLRVEAIPDPVPGSVAPVVPAPAAEAQLPTPARRPVAASLTPAEMHELLSSAGTLHNIDADLLASIVHAESGGHVRAVSRTGARGLMQLMPGTAATLGVHDSFAPDQNIAGGTAYLDALLTRYHDNIAFALAAYNAGPAAVDRYHGVPPYAETRAYVARVIREFNRLKKAEAKPQPDQTAALATAPAMKGASAVSISDGVTTIYLKP